MNIQELKQEKAKLVNAAGELIEAVDKEKRSYNSDEQKTWDEYQEKINKIDMEIDHTEKRERVKYLQDGIKNNTSPKSGPTAIAKKDDNTSRNAFRGWLKSNCRQALSNDERAALDLHGVQYGVDKYHARNDGQILSSFPEKRAMTEGTWAFTGGASPLFSYVTDMASLIDVALKQYGTLLNTSTILPTATGFVLPIPTSNDTSHSATLTAEDGSITPVDIASLSNIYLNAYKLTASIVFSQELLNDTVGAGFPLESFLSQQLGIRMARGMESYLATGSGSSQPQGITVGATDSGIVLGGTSANPIWTGDNLIDLVEGTVDPAYMQQDGYGIVAHQKTIVSWRKIKSTTGEYLFQDSGPALNDLSKKPSGFLRGVPVFMNNSMPIPGTQGNVLAVCGQLKKLLIRKVNEVVFLYNPYLYSLNNQILLQAYMRFDSKVIDAGTHPISSVANP